MCSHCWGCPIPWMWSMLVYILCTDDSVLRSVLQFKCYITRSSNRCHKSELAIIKNIEIMVKGESAIPVQCSWLWNVVCSCVRVRTSVGVVNIPTNSVWKNFLCVSYFEVGIGVIFLRLSGTNLAEPESVLVKNHTVRSRGSRT